MELGLAPWTLPIDTLRWGRWTSATRSAIWIVWEGPHPLRIAFLDGVRTGDVTIHPGAVDVGGARLTVSDDAMITNATLGAQRGGARRRGRGPADERVPARALGGARTLSCPAASPLRRRGARRRRLVPRVR